MAGANVQRRKYSSFRSLVPLFFHPATSAMAWERLERCCCFI
jgi:hypothetical protein